METSPIWRSRLPRYFDPEDQTTLVACNVKVGVYSPPSLRFNTSSQVAINMAIQLISTFVESRNIPSQSQSIGSQRSKHLHQAGCMGCHSIEFEGAQRKTGSAQCAQVGIYNAGQLNGPAV